MGSDQETTLPYRYSQSKIRWSSHFTKNFQCFTLPPLSKKLAKWDMELPEAFVA